VDYGSRISGAADCDPDSVPHDIDADSDAVAAERDAGSCHGDAGANVDPHADGNARAYLIADVHADAKAYRYTAAGCLDAT
jgi:hypothetical protein